MKIFKQETSRSCGIACLRSIFSYYGKDFPEKEIFDRGNFFKTEKMVRSLIISLGVTALEFGFKVKYIGYNPMLVNRNPKQSLKESLIEKEKKYSGLGKFYIEQTLKFLDLSGEFITDKLNADKLKKLIDENKFILVEVKPAFLGQAHSISMNHKLILDGYNEKEFHVLDPARGEGRYIDFDSFMIAFYSAIPEILVIKK